MAQIVALSGQSWMVTPTEERGEGYHRKLLAEGYEVSDLAAASLSSLSFERNVFGPPIELVACSLRELGFSHHPTDEEVRRRALQFNLGDCPLRAWPELLLQRKLSAAAILFFKTAEVRVLLREKTVLGVRTKKVALGIRHGYPHPALLAVDYPEGELVWCLGTDLVFAKNPVIKEMGNATADIREGYV